MKNKTLITLTIIFSLPASLTAQIASNPPYKLEQAVIASGGGQNSAGGNFALDGTIGQSVAGTTSSNPPFSVAGGFWTAAPLTPTAASVSIFGKVVTDDGRGLTNSLIVLTDMQGNSRTVRSSTFGYFRFKEVEAGQSYILTVVSKRYQFSPQILTVFEDIDNINLTADAKFEKTKDR